VRITLKKAYTDGTLAVDMDPLSQLCQLATSVPPRALVVAALPAMAAPVGSGTPLRSSIDRAVQAAPPGVRAGSGSARAMQAPGVTGGGGGGGHMAMILVGLAPDRAGANRGEVRGNDSGRALAIRCPRKPRPPGTRGPPRYSCLWPPPGV